MPTFYYLAYDWTGPSLVSHEVNGGQHLGRLDCGGTAGLVPTLLNPEEGSEGHGGVPQGAQLAWWLSVLLHATPPHLSDDPSLR